MRPRSQSRPPRGGQSLPRRPGGSVSGGHGGVHVRDINNLKPSERAHQPSRTAMADNTASSTKKIYIYMARNYGECQWAVAPPKRTFHFPKWKWPVWPASCYAESRTLSPQCTLNSCIRRTVHIRTWLVGTAMGLGSTREVKRGCGNWREALGKKSGVGKTKTSHLQC